MRRSSASPSLTVSAMSSGVDISYGTVATWPHRSTAMTSAPSWASRTACDRPWPRAAPVMKATLPATRPAMLRTTSLLVGEPRVDRQRHAGDVAGVVGYQPQDRVGDVHWLDHVDRERVGHRLGQAGGACQERLHDVVYHHGRADPGRVHRAQPDAGRGPVVHV